MLEKRPHLIPAVVAAVMLLLALAPLPYGYYQLLKFVVCGTAGYVAFMAYNWKKIWAMWLFGFIAILFNPLIPIHLSREVWQPIDVVCAALLVCGVFILKNPAEKETNDAMNLRGEWIAKKIKPMLFHVVAIIFLAFWFFYVNITSEDSQPDDSKRDIFNFSFTFAIVWYLSGWVGLRLCQKLDGKSCETMGQADKMCTIIVGGPVLIIGSIVEYLKQKKRAKLARGK